jgi:hypothetical protein
VVRPAPAMAKPGETTVSEPEWRSELRRRAGEAEAPPADGGQPATPVPTPDGPRLAAAPDTAAAFGVPLTFTVTIHSGASAVPTGTVTFRDGARALGAVALDDAGQARLTVADLPVGEHEIQVEYPGDTNFAASTAAMHQTISRTTTRTTVTSSAVTAAFGEVVTLEAMVRSEAGGSPTGTVTFRDGTTPLATVPLDGAGSARVEADLGWGRHTVSAMYSGDATFGPSVATTTQLIQARTATDLTATPTRSSFGDRVELVATVRSGVPAAVTGNVTFVDGDDDLGFVPLDGSGEARLSIASLAADDHLLGAHYGGDTRFLPSAARATHHVDKAMTSARITVCLPTDDAVSTVKGGTAHES